MLGSYGPIFSQYALGPAEVATHKHLLGVTGMGKSMLMASMFVQLLNQGVGVALIDPHSDLALNILGLLYDTKFFDHPQAFDRLLYVDFARSDRALPFNVLNQPYDDHTVARNIAEVCKRAWPALGDGSAPNFENIMLAATLVLVQNHLPLTELPRLLTDKAFRDGLLQNVTDSVVVDFFLSRFDRWGKEAPMLIESTLRRAFLLTFSPALRYSLGQRENALNFRDLMDRGVSLICNLGGLDEDSQRFLGCLITVGYEMAALSRADVPEEARRQYHLIIDEFSMFSAQSEEALARMLSLTRKFGLYCTLAHQSWTQLSQRLQGALGNCIDVAFRLGRGDAVWAAPRFGQFDPYLVKHEVLDPDQVDRTHPLYFNVQETHEGWARALEELRPREAYVKVANRTAKIRTLKFPPRKASVSELRALTDQYAAQLMRPRSGGEENTNEQRPMSAQGQLVFRSVPIKDR